MRRPATRILALGKGLLQVCLGLLCLVAMGCGDPQPEKSLETLIAELDVLRDAQQEEAIQAIGRLGAKDPETVVPRLIELMRSERFDPLANTFDFTVDLSGTDLEPKDYAAAVGETTRVFAMRLRGYGYSPASFVSQARSNEIQMTIPRPRPVELDPDAADGEKVRPLEGAAREKAEALWNERLLRRLEQPGRFELLIAVDPPGEGEAPSLWKGSRESFERFVDEETPRLEQAYRERRPFESARPDFRLTLLRPEKPGGPLRRVVLRLPLGEDERFGTDNIAIRRGRDEETNELALGLRVKEEAAGRFRAWTKQHVGRGLAFVCNGRAELVVPITEPLDGVLALHLGPADDPEVRAWMEGIMRGLELGTHPYPVRGELQSGLPPGTITPIVRCIAAVGEPAAPYLVELAKEGGDMGERATRALEHLRRRLLTPPPERSN